MRLHSFLPSVTRRLLAPFAAASVAFVAFYAAACATSPSTSSSSVGENAPNVTAAAPKPDPRVGLAPGTIRVDSTLRVPRRVVATPAQEVAWNMRLISNTPTARDFRGQTNSDLAFTRNYAIQGNYDGFMVWDIANPASPTLVNGYLCPASQSDVSVYKNLLFVSGEDQSGRTDCGIQGVREPVSPVRLRGIRIFDVTDMRNPTYVTNVQTCRGSHTHTVVTDPKDSQNVYIYVSGSSGVRPADELPGCQDLGEDPNSARFRIEVIKVPLAAPHTAAIVSSPRIFTGLAAVTSATRPPEPGSGGGGGGGARGGGRGAGADSAAAGGGGRGGRGAAADSLFAGRGGRGGGRGGGARTGPDQCHDITTYPAVGLAGGACRGYGLLIDIRDVTNPVRIDQAADSNMAMWHSATFSNDGSKVLFSDEWGGGSGARCRSTDKYEWGANALFTIEDGKMKFQSYYKMPAPQTVWENCVAHNGSLIPIPGREVMVQGWYQGGISVFDWTDIANPKEIAFFDRGPTQVTHPDSVRIVSGGSWSVYWYNGLIVNSEIFRGLDILELSPSPFISQNELDAAKTVRLEYLNAQEQPQFVWPASFALARAYVDQLERSRGLASGRITVVRNELARAEGLSGQQRSQALSQLATQIDRDAGSGRDRPKVLMLASAVRDLSSAQR